MKNARIILPILTLTAVASFYYAWQNTPRTQLVADDYGTTRSEAVRIADSSLERNRLDFSGGEQQKFNRPRRNLFGSLFPPPPPAKVQPKVVVEPVRTVTPQVKPPPPPPVVVRSNTGRMPPFKILGFLEKNDQLTAFVSLQGEIYLVKKEQLLADEYRVADLNHQSITIARVEGAGQVSMPLSDAVTGAPGLTRGAIPGPAVRPRVPAAHPPFRN